jgi:hypothetical protein
MQPGREHQEGNFMMLKVLMVTQTKAQDPVALVPESHRKVRKQGLNLNLIVPKGRAGYLPGFRRL